MVEEELSYSKSLFPSFHHTEYECVSNPGVFVAAIISLRRQFVLPR